MSESVNGFLGTWQVRWITGEDPAFPEGTRFQIGTGEEGAAQPFLDAKNNVAVGFVIQEPDAQAPNGWSTVLSSGGATKPLLYSDGILHWEDFPASGEDSRFLRIYISLAATLDGKTRYLYGTTLRGDPEQVAVWGATDHTPP